MENRECPPTTPIDWWDVEVENAELELRTREKLEEEERNELLRAGVIARREDLTFRQPVVAAAAKIANDGTQPSTEAVPVEATTETVKDEAREARVAVAAHFAQLKADEAAEHLARRTRPVPGVRQNLRSIVTSVRYDAEDVGPKDGQKPDSGRVYDGAEEIVGDDVEVAEELDAMATGESDETAAQNGDGASEEELEKSNSEESNDIENIRRDSVSNEVSKTDDKENNEHKLFGNGEIIDKGIKSKLDTESADQKRALKKVRKVKTVKPNKDNSSIAVSTKADEGHRRLSKEERKKLKLAVIGKALSHEIEVKKTKFASKILKTCDDNDGKNTKPVATKAGVFGSEASPVVSKDASVVSEAAPVVSKDASVVSEAAPVLSNAAHVISNAASVVSDDENDSSLEGDDELSSSGEEDFAADFAVPALELLAPPTEGQLRVTSAAPRYKKLQQAASKKRKHTDDTLAAFADASTHVRLSARERRKALRDEKEAARPIRYYDVVNVKNKNRDRVKPVDPDLANRGHTKKAPKKVKK